MKNFGKIISDKDIITKEYLDSKGYISAITSKMVTDALGFTPFDSAAFTKASIKNALGISDWALAASKPSYDDRYLKLSGGTINGVLSLADELRGRPLTNPAKEYVISQWRFISSGDTVYLQAGTANGNTNGNLAFSGYSGNAAEDIYFNAKSSRFNGSWSVQTSLASVSLLSNIFDVNASLKVQPGWYLYLNGEAIMKWSDLKSKITYSFSEISSKPTTLSGYGITDALKIGSSFAPTTSGEPSIIGYSGISEGWPAGGPAMRWGTNGYYARLQVELNTNNPRLLLSGVYNNTAYAWVEILTDKNFSSFGIANMSNDASGSANDILTSSVNGVVERLTDTPIKYGNLLTFAPKDAYYQSQLIINYQSDMVIRGRSGSWSDWAKVVTDKNFASYGVKAGNLNTTGSVNDITVPSIVGDVESLQNMPFHYCNVLTITTTPHYYVGQIAIDYAGRMAVRGQDGATWSSWSTVLDTNNIGTTSLPKINLNGWTISNWNQVRMGASVLIPMTGTQILYPNEHYTYVETLTSSSNISFTLTDDTSGVSITKIYYIVFRTGATTPTFTFNRTLYWKDGKTLTSLAANKRYRIVIDDNLATLETYS